MNKVLFLSYYFPPSGGGGVQRSSKFVKYLSDYDWEPIVITVHNEHWQPRDETLCQDVKGIGIYRTKSNIFPILVQKPLGWLISGGCLYPDIQLGWLPYLHKKVDKILAKEKISVVYTSCSPFSVNLEGLRIKKKYGIPWVTDFRDPWTLNVTYKPNNPVYARLSQNLEKRTMKYCDYYIANTKGNLSRARDVFPVIKNKSTWIPNGFDLDDFRFDKNKKNNQPIWQLTYTGSCYTSYSPEPVFRVVRNFLDGTKECKILINYAGTSADLFIKIASKYKLESIIRQCGYLNHQESIRLIQNSDILLLFLPNDEKATSWVPGKLYEYLASGVPILAVVPKGDAFQIVNESKAGITLTHEEAEQRGSDVLAYLWARWKKGENWSFHNWEYIKRYDRRVLTEKLVNVFNSLKG